MSHNFLFNLYDYIDRRLGDLESDLVSVDADEDAGQDTAGRIDILCEVERFIGEQFEVKLPKRLRNQRSQRPTVCMRLSSED